MQAGCAPLVPPQTEDLVLDHRPGLGSLLDLALVYLHDLCRTTLSALGRHSLRSTEQGVLSSLLLAQQLSGITPSQWMAPLCWNGQPLELLLFQGSTLTLSKLI